jgi:hypothetical protein
LSHFNETEVEGCGFKMAFLFYFNTARMKFLEKDLKQIIFETDKQLLARRGLFLKGKQFRQLRIGNYGVADLVYFQRPRIFVNGESHLRGSITIVELKQNKINVSAFFQAIRYAKGITRYLETRGLDVADNFDFRIILVGSDIDLNSDVVYLPDIFPDPESERFSHESIHTSVELYTYQININGMTFKEIKQYALETENI